MTRLQTGTVGGLSLIVGVASLTIGIVSLLTSLHAGVPSLGDRPKPPETAAIVVSGGHRDYPGHAVQIRFVASPSLSRSGMSCPGVCKAARVPATIRD